MERAKINVQDQVLNVARKERARVELHLLNGEKIFGQIQSFDGNCILLKTEDEKEVMVYKHALVSLTPEKPLPLDRKEKAKEGE